MFIFVENVGIKTTNHEEKSLLVTNHSKQRTTQRMEVL